MVQGGESPDCWFRTIFLVESCRLVSLDIWTDAGHLLLLSHHLLARVSPLSIVSSWSRHQCIVLTLYFSFSCRHHSQILTASQGPAGTSTSPAPPLHLALQELGDSLELCQSPNNQISMVVVVVVYLILILFLLSPFPLLSTPSQVVPKQQGPFDVVTAGAGGSTETRPGQSPRARAQLFLH